MGASTSQSLGGGGGGTSQDGEVEGGESFMSVEMSASSYDGRLNISKEGFQSFDVSSLTSIADFCDAGSNNSSACQTKRRFLTGVEDFKPTAESIPPEKICLDIPQINICRPATPSPVDSGSTTPTRRLSSTHSSPSSSPIDPGMFIQHQVAHFSDRYIREKKLGAGAYGEVLLCREKESGERRAIKIIKKTSVKSNKGAQLLGEVNVVKQLDHPNIMKLYEFFEDRKNYYLVSDVYSGGELFDEITNRQRFTETDAAHTMKQVLSGVTYLHRYNIVHRDLKPENLLLENKTEEALVKIVDFGLSAYFDPSKKMKERLGTAYYIAPEVLKMTYDEKCDVWSCGVILYILLCGYPPFSGNSDREILVQVEKGKYEFDLPEWSTISAEAQDLVSKMLTMDPTARISAEQALYHPWITNHAFGRKDKSAVRSPLLVRALGNMRKFHAGQKMANAALLFIGSKLTTAEETRELTKIFRNLDTNGDGQLDKKELAAGYLRLFELRGEEIGGVCKQQVEEEVDKILDSVDFDKNGYVEYSEFVTVAMDKKVLLSRERLRKAFELFDVDKSGTIASEELRRFVIDVDDQQWNEIIQEVDQNNDGEVDFEEFVAMMHRCI